MKKLMTIAMLGVTALAFSLPYALAATQSTAPITTTAVVSSSLTLSVLMKKNDSNGATVTSMNYGQLSDIGTGTLRSSPTGTTGTGSVVAYITANSQGLPYTITQTGTTISNGTTTLPNGALAVTPVYATQDNGGAAKPAAAVVGSAGTWVGTRTLYTSEAAGALRTIQAHYAITDDPAAGATTGVPLNQQAGTYNGTVTITVTA